MADLSKYGEWALIAGAAEGIGKAYCEYLAGKKINIILLDVKEEGAYALSQKLKEKYHIRTECVYIDLANENSVSQIVSALKNKNCRLVVYNAAYGPVKKFYQNTPEELDRYLNVNCRTPIHLIRQLITLWDSKPGAFVLMSSLAGLFGAQLVAPYSATKAFDINLGEALYYELKPKNIDVLVCCAGATDTPNFRDTQPDLSIFPKPHVGQPKTIPAEAFKHLGRKPEHIAGFQNRINYFFLSRILPRKTASKIFNRTMMSLYKNVIK